MLAAAPFDSRRFGRTRARRHLNIVTIILLAFLSSACSETEWCDSRDAKALRERDVSSMYYETVHEFLAAKPDAPIALFAHRGGYHCELMDVAPENSIPNMEKAIRMGFDGLETDLWLSKDGEFLIHHDETLDRTTTGTGDVAAITFEESRQLRLTYPSGEVSDERIPTFREFVQAGRGRILLLVELKGTSPERFLDLVDIARETSSLDHVLFWIDWTEEYAELFEQHLDSGVQEVRSNVLWRTRTLEALDDVYHRFNPIMVDIPPSMKELGKEKGYQSYIFGILPEGHLSIVEAANAYGVKVLVSKVATNSYVRGLRKKGVRAFMSRAPEVQLHYLIDKGWHH